MGNTAIGIKVRNITISNESPQVCVPLVSETEEALVAELKNILSRTSLPDLIEWRVDFFADIQKTDSVLSCLKTLRPILKEIPLIFTIRAEEERGEIIPLNHQGKVELLKRVIQSRDVDILDFELLHTESFIKEIREISSEYGVKLILSYHNFDETPSTAFILKKLHESESLGADLAKLAVMPNDKADVLKLLNATLEANAVINIPLITMSMGGYGSLSRMIGSIFGSAVTFAKGDNSSAPGQIPIEELKAVMNIVDRHCK
jgi:3-dehydroquinate dehydratase-1